MKQKTFNDCNTVPRQTGRYEIQSNAPLPTWAYWDGKAWHEPTTETGGGIAKKMPVAANQKLAWR